MKKYFSLLFFIFYLYSFSQSKKFEYEVTYNFDSQLDSTNISHRDENFVLLFNKDESYYANQKILTADSILNNSNDQDQIIAANSMSTSTFFMDRIHNFIKTKKIVSEIKNESNFFSYSIPMLSDWKITGNKKLINNTECKEAIIFAFGRNWKVYFSEEYPFHFGPFLFSGLPGLIFQVEDEKGFYKFSLLSLKKKDINLNFDYNVKEVKREEYYQLIYNTKFSSDFFNHFTIPGNPEEKVKMKKAFEAGMKKLNNYPIDKRMRYIFN